MGKQLIDLASGLFPATNPARVDTVQGQRRYVLFNDTTAEKIRNVIPIPEFGSNLKIRLRLATRNTQTGIKKVGFKIRLDARTPNTDTIDLETDDFDTDNLLEHTLANNQAAGLIRESLFSLTDIDGLVANNELSIEIERNVAVGDNASGDIELMPIAILEWDD